MKIIIIVVGVFFALADTFFMLCLLRANTLYEQGENMRLQKDNENDKLGTSDEGH